ncbi:MAG: OmpA family protein, partial [Hyphomicrobiaceae bacterium]
RSRLAERLESLAERAGSDERLLASVARVIDGALREAEVQRHDELSQAIAPLVVKTIKSEIVNSRDEMVEALYPITGRLVSAYVSNAVKDMMADINRRLESGLTSNRFMLKMKSLTTGRSMAELALAESAKVDVEEIYVIRRGSGQLLHHWQDPAKADIVGSGGNRDVLVGGFLAAISDFAEEAFAADQSSLQTLDLKQHRIYLRASPTLLVAAKCNAVDVPAAERVIDEAFLGFLSRIGDEKQDEASAVDTLATTLETRLDAGRREARSGGLGPLKWLALLVGLSLAGWLGYAFYIDWRTEEARSAARRAIDAAPELVGYPIVLEVARGGHAVEVSGLAPSEDQKSQLMARLKRALPAASLRERLAVVPGSRAIPDAGPALAALAERLALAEARGRIMALALPVERGVLGLDAQIATLRRLAEARASRRATPDQGEAATLAALVTARGALDEARRRIASGSVGDETDRTLTGMIGRTWRSLVAAGRQLVEGKDGARHETPPRDLKAAAEAVANEVQRLADLVSEREREATLAPLRQSLRQLGARLDGLKLPAPPTPRERLAIWTRDNAIFFANGSEWRDARAAQATLAALVRLMRERPGLLRIVGFTDETGGSSQNSPLALQRATRVRDELVRLGVPASVLTAVGRANGPNLSPDAGPDSPNRRVQFELVFPGER